MRRKTLIDNNPIAAYMSTRWNEIYETYETVDYNTMQEINDKVKKDAKLIYLNKYDAFVNLQQTYDTMKHCSETAKKQLKTFNKMVKEMGSSSS